MNRKQRRSNARVPSRRGPEPAGPRSVADLLLPPAPLASLTFAAPPADPVAAALARLKRQETESEAIAAAEHRARAAPDDIGAWLKLGQLLARAGRRPDALAAFQRCQALAPEREEVRHLIAALGGAAAPERASDAYVANVFDGMAERFDETLVTFLDYRAPEILGALMDRLLAGRKALDIVDLGCGTGLMAPLLKPRARRLLGIDLSAEMLKRAAERRLYDELVQAEIGAWLSARPAGIDLAIAADVLCYFGALETVLRAAATAIRPGGLLLFTVERQDQQPWTLTTTGRYAHAQGYLRAATVAGGWSVEAFDAVTLRVENAVPVQGYAVALRRPA
jgi:predicted TPR repeat methyltransferase